MIGDVLWWGALAGLGFGVGILAGMFGVGGGFMLTPLLAVFFGVPLPVAIGTGLCQMIGVATAALLRHSRLGQGEIKVDWLMMAGSLMGVKLGAQTVSALSKMGAAHLAGHAIPSAKLALSAGYILLLAGVALWMARDNRRRAKERGGPAPEPGALTRIPLPPMTRLPRTGYPISIALVAYLGLGMGFLSGLLGIGGGVALMPVLIYGIGMRVRMAAGTGILVLLVTCLSGTFFHALEGHIHLGMAMTLLIGSTIGAQIGATLTSRLDGPRLRGYFVYVILATIAAVTWDLLRALFSG